MVSSPWQEGCYYRWEGVFLTFEVYITDGGLRTSIDCNGLGQLCQYSGHFDCQGKSKGQNEKERQADATANDVNKESCLRT